MAHGARGGKARVESRAFRFVSALILFALPSIGVSQAITEYAVATPAPTDLYGITKDPDGAVWFGESRTAKIGRVAPDGSIITAGPDENLWFTDLSGAIGRITPDGVVTRFALSSQSAAPIAIATGADGNIWFTETGANKIGRLQPGGTGAPLCVTDSHTLCLNNNRFAVTASFQQAPDGPSVQATAVPLTADTGYFWFFDASNIELVTKVLNGCASNDAYWVFAAGLTNVGVNLTVMDMQSGVLMKTYENPIGTPFAPIQDTNAFRTCP